MECPNCQATNPDGSQFCLKCAQRLTNPATCSECGHSNPEASLFCNRCGKPIDQTKKAGIQPAGLKKTGNNQKLMIGLGIGGLLIFVLILAFVMIPTHPKQNPKQQPGVEEPSAESGPSSPGREQVEPYVETDPTANPDLQDKLKKLQAELEAAPDSISLRIAMGNHYYDFGYFIHAIEVYQDVLADDSTKVDVIVDCATSYFYSQQANEAIELYRRALQIDPNHVNANYNLAIVLNSTGQHEQAIKWFENALRLQPEGPMANRARQFIDRFNQIKDGQM